MPARIALPEYSFPFNKSILADSEDPIDLT